MATAKVKNPVKKYKNLELISLTGHEGTLYEPDRLRGKVRCDKKNGSVSVHWVYRYPSKITGKDREIACGVWRADGGTSMTHIRRERDRYKALVIEGKDPLEERDKRVEQDIRDRAKRQREREENRTVNDLLDAWLAQVDHIDGGAEASWRLAKYVRPVIGTVPVRELRSDRVRESLLPLVRRNVNRTARLVFDTLRTSFLWAEKRQPWRRLLSEENPVALVDIRRMLPRHYRNVGRRKLLGEEVTELDQRFYAVRRDYDNAPAGQRYGVIRPISEKVEIAVWIMLSTLSRPGALAIAHWENVDFKAHVWHIPIEDVKASDSEAYEGVDVQMSDFTYAQFRRLHAITGHTPWLFPARGDDGPVKSEAKIFSRPLHERQGGGGGGARRAKNESLLLSGGVWTPRDLRRSGVTLMESMKISPIAIKGCQGHVLRSGVDAHYMQHDWSVDLRDAWARLGALLDVLAPCAAKEFYVSGP